MGKIRAHTQNILIGVESDLCQATHLVLCKTLLNFVFFLFPIAATIAVNHLVLFKNSDNSVVVNSVSGAVRCAINAQVEHI